MKICKIGQIRPRAVFTISKKKQSYWTELQCRKMEERTIVSERSKNSHLLKTQEKNSVYGCLCGGGGGGQLCTLCMWMKKNRYHSITHQAQHSYSYKPNQQQPVCSYISPPLCFYELKLLVILIKVCDILSLFTYLTAPR